MNTTERAELAVILAAGGGRRMGRAKGLLVWRDTPLILHHVAALRPVAERVVAILGSDAPAHRAILAGRGIDVVHNPDWHTTWPADSLRLGLLAHPTAGRVLVTPVDTPPAASATLEALLARTGPAVPENDRGPGHPVLLDRALADRIRDRAPEGGLRAILTRAERVPVGQSDVELDFDTADDWSRWVADIGSTGDG